MQYATPQFIEEEGKIISFLTFRQFFMLVGSGALCILLFFILPFSLFVILSIIIAGLTVVIAFVKIDNASALTIFLNFLGFMVASKNYIWKKKESAYPFNKIQKRPELGVIQDSTPMPKMQESKLQSIRKMIETRK